MLEIHSRSQLGTEGQFWIILRHFTDIADQESRKIFVADIRSYHFIPLNNSGIFCDQFHIQHAAVHQCQITIDNTNIPIFADHAADIACIINDTSYNRWIGIHLCHNSHKTIIRHNIHIFFYAVGTSFVDGKCIIPVAGVFSYNSGTCHLIRWILLWKFKKLEQIFIIWQVILHRC